MVATTAPTVTGTWSSVFSGGGDVLLQLRTVSEPVEIVVKTGVAPVGDGPHGILLTKELPALAISEMDVADVVYARSLDGDAVLATLGG